MIDMREEEVTETVDVLAEPGPGARERLLVTCIAVFGRYGFEGTSTRALAEAAGVNLQAIQYYFGGKEGLYVAAAEYIAGEVSARIGARVRQAQERVATAVNASQAMGKAEARNALSGIVGAMAELFLDKSSEPWAALMIREQMQPTQVFHILYGKVMGPALETIRSLLAVLLDDEPDSDRVRLRALSLVGSVLVFRVAHAAVVAQMGWSEIRPDNVGSVRSTLDDIIRNIGLEEGPS